MPDSQNPMDFWSNAQAGVQNYFPLMGGKNPSAYFPSLSAASGPLSQAAFGNLFMNLMNQGQTDPRIMNQLFQQIGRGTQAQQRQSAGQFAASGLENSGLGAALNAAIGQSGNQAMAQAKVADLQNAQMRNMQYLQLFQQLMGGPSVDLYGMGLGQMNASANRNQTGNASNLGFWGALLNGVMQAYGGGGK